MTVSTLSGVDVMPPPLQVTDNSDLTTSIGVVGQLAVSTQLGYDGRVWVRTQTGWAQIA